MTDAKQPEPLSLADEADTADDAGHTTARKANAYYLCLLSDCSQMIRRQYAELETLALYKNLADEYGLSIFPDIAEMTAELETLRAFHGQAPAGESLRTDALCDLSYSHGLKAGWNYCASDDLAGFERAQKIGTEALRTLKSPTAQAAPAAVAGADEIDRLRAALVYVAFALHGTRQYMLAEGVTLIDGDTVRVSRDGWTVEASSNPLRQPEPKPSPAAQGDVLDTMRLDWLDADAGKCLLYLGKSWYTRPSYGLPYCKRASLREAIDAVIAAQQGDKT
jgi:hypothetical protein